MAVKPNLSKLSTSWTKYDVVKMINVIGNDQLSEYKGHEEMINQPVLRAYLGIGSEDEETPPYFQKVIMDFPNERKLFAMLAGIFTHHENILAFANTYSTANMGGKYVVDDKAKNKTNMRSALVESGAAPTSYRRKQEVPYSFVKLFAQQDIGQFFKDLLKNRLAKIGHSNDEINVSFYELCYSYDFHKAIGLNKTQFKSWLEGKSVYQIKEFKFDLGTFKDKYSSNPSIQVQQWLTEWNSVDYSLPLRSKPADHFFMFKIDIRILKRISDVHRRKFNKTAGTDVNVQRTLKEDRSLEIKNFVHKGFPLSTLNDRDRASEENQILKMPGFLSTAILVNIIGPGQSRGNSKIKDEDLVKITEEGNTHMITLPEAVFSEKWNPELKPIEIIDGQHRLWAFDETEAIDGQFEVPVIAYYSLDRAWQAYLFYVINIKPKKINTSLGYDLYPLLRTQEWLENSKDGLKVYRETRAQELVEALWTYPESPWYRRISMLGEESGNISQNAFVRAFTSSYFKKTRKGTSGIFSDVVTKKEEEIRWVRAQQAAFVILLWDAISKALKPEITKEGQLGWVDEVRNDSYSMSSNEHELELDKSFVSKSSNLSRDQGVSGISLFSNDLFYTLANEGLIELNDLEWESDIDERQIQSENIDKAIEQFMSHPLYNYIQIFAMEVIKLDWRTSSKYRGSGGYREVWNDLLQIFLKSTNENFKKCSEILSPID
ncbi:DGQHR domain-containing protein [Telluribacter sp.]|jgi:DGQHR domain-containing protein|uniref:DGQHR domain-containing protein n=1 Tax=Telluribacter sp. TaxID=1978767 RepID=UPI002E0FCF91|nr:DGQHR domain-containing protein [Telluribacter sp.]